jgi:hypothetical protein
LVLRGTREQTSGEKNTVRSLLMCIHDQILGELGKRTFLKLLLLY